MFVCVRAFGLAAHFHFMYFVGVQCCAVVQTAMQPLTKPTTTPTKNSTTHTHTDWWREGGGRAFWAFWARAHGVKSNDVCTLAHLNQRFNSANASAENSRASEWRSGGVAECVCVCVQIASVCARALARCDAMWRAVIVHDDRAISLLATECD